MTVFGQTSLVVLAGALLGAPSIGSAQEADYQLEAGYQAELAALAASPAVVRALELVDERDARVMSDLLQLTEIPAPPFKEETRALRFFEMLIDLGVDSA